MQFWIDYGIMYLYYYNFSKEDTIMAKTPLFTRLMSVLLLIAMLAGLMPAITRSMTANISAADTTWDVDGDGTLSILCIGNSFSVDAMEHIPQIAKNLGITSIQLGNLYIGSCALATHWTNASGDKAAYTYYQNTGGSWSTTANYKMSTALTSRSWDYVSMQQASPKSGQADTYDSSLTNLISYVKGKLTNSATKLIWHMTWAYQANSTKAEFADYGKNQTTMYNAIVSAVQSKIVSNSDFAFVVPSGTAIQNSRSSLIRDNLCRDGYHLNKNIGRYIAGLTFVKSLGIDISGVTWVTGSIPVAYRKIAIESATNAVATPFSVTQSAYTTPKGNADYTIFTPKWTYNAYWNCKSATHSNTMYKPASTHKHYNLYACTPRYTNYNIPVGSIILLIGDTFQFRSDSWVNDSGVQTWRDNVVTASHTVCSDEWWSKSESQPFLYRSFNISRTDGKTMANSSADYNGSLQIYVPTEYVRKDLQPDVLNATINDLIKNKLPVPNNQRVEWGKESDIKAMYSKNANGDYIENKKTYIMVSDSRTTGSSYAWDPITPRLWGTFQATPVDVVDRGGAQRVAGADPSWGVQITYYGGNSAGSDKDPFTSNGKSTMIAAFKVKLPQQKLETSDGDLDGRYLTNVCSYKSNGYVNTIKNSWRLKSDDYYKSLAATDTTSVGWRKHWERAHLFFNYDYDRFHFTWWAQYDGSRTGDKVVGDGKASTAVRSMLAKPSTEDPYFYLGTSELSNTPATNYAAFLLFEVKTNMPNTEPLYQKIKEAQQYIYVDHTYFPTQYETFMSALTTAVDVYLLNNGQANNSQTTVTNALNGLTNALKKLNAAPKIDSIPIPYTMRVSVGVSDKNCADGKLNGTYFISRYYTGNMDYVHSFIDKSKLSGGDWGIERLRVSSTSNGGVQANDLSCAITLRGVGGQGYTLQTENGDFLTYSGANLTALGTAQTFNITASDYETGTYKGGISIYTSNNAYVLYCDAQTNYDWSLISPTAKEDGKTQNQARNRADFHLYQCSPATLELYRALKFIKPYYEPNEAIKRYPNELYKQFLADVDSAISAYTTHNTKDSFSNASAKTTCETWAKKLRAWADTLTQADMTLNYIDIPIEIFDFKADGMLFEHDNVGTNYYGLSSSAAGISPAMPAGLVESELVDGKPVYKPATVAYVAKCIMTDKGVANDSVNKLTACGADYNESFRNKMKTIVEEGSWDETLYKTTTGENGGELDWNEVSTAYDLAYYGLTYIWREVPTTDANKLTDGDRYNIRVPQRETLRLYKEANAKLYTFFSDNNMAYNGTYMYNTFPTIANPNIGQYGDFMPINGLGFETGGKNTDNSVYYANQGRVDKFREDNFHYAMHAYGSFVYYEDQDLYFDFLGDDDVYFFIEDHLVLDIGGSHNPLGGTVNLKNVTLADGSKLVDGEVYSFDMYYAERHLTGSNMKFSTNIKIVDTDTLTTKGQYIEINGDNDMVDELTGMGAELLDNGLVKVGDTVAYSFNIVNSHNVNVYDLILMDNTLGTYISKDVVDLANEELTYTPTDITDIEVYYRTSGKDGDAIVIDTSTPVRKSVDEIKSMINAANTACQTEPGTSLPTGSYRVTMTSTQDLMDLMELGIPSNCQIIVYGFKRMFTEEDQNTTVSNEIEISCSYLPWSSNEAGLSVRTLTGTASRILKVAALSGIPQAAKVEYVIDYGKPLAIDITNTISNATGVTNNGFVGFTKSGYNGEFLKAAPKDLNPVMDTGTGIFEHRLGKVYYSLTDMLSRVETVYAVYALSGCEVTDASGKARNYPYMLSEITVVPATTMYYETDFDQIDFVGDSSPYVMIDFGSNDKTVWGTTTPHNMTGTKVDGIFRGTVSGTDPYIVMDYTTGSALSHKVISTDVVKVRIKSDPCIGDGLQVFFMTDTNANPAGGISTDIAPYTPNKQWQIITLPIFSEVVGKTIKGIRLDPIGNNNSFQSNGSFEYDWVYIGPDVADSSMFAYNSDEGSVFTTHTTSTANPWQTIGASHTTLQTPTFVGDEDTYGYDSAYDNESIHSNNSSLFVVGAGVPLVNPSDYSPNYAASPAYTETSFSFSGTGFDIISRTGAQQGALRAFIYTEAGKFVKVVSVINSGVLELYQIPVISVRDLDYGTYHVKIFVNAPYTNASIPALNRGGEFYFDAVRIYNPLDVTSGTKESKLAYEIYLRHGEADHVVTETRDILIGANSFTAGSAMNGIAYIDANAVAKNEVDLRFIDDKNYDLVRKQETNLGDFAADALRYVFEQEGKHVDAAIVLGEDIRANLYLGDVYQINCQAVHPNENLACAREVTGQQLLDALEWGARWAGLNPTKFFLQVSGISYEIHRNIPSTVQKDENNNWCGAPTGEYRVKNVMIGGKPLDPDAVYLIAGYSNILRNCENGFAMFSDAGEVHLQPMRDSYVLESYIKSFPVINGFPTIQAENSVLGAKYGNMNGEGRIALVDNDSADPSEGDAIAPTPVVIEKAPEIKNYMHLGPNQEVYLNPNSGIAFKIEATGTLPSRIDIAARSADGKEVVLAVSISNTPPTDLQNAFGVKIISCTAQYYGLGLTEADWSEADGKKFAYAAISNNGSGILSITDIKYAYNSVETALRSRSANRYLSFLVDEAMLEAYGVCVEHDLTYVDMGDQHEASCTKCEFTEIVEHTFVEGKCICGVSENTEPIVDNALKFNMNITVGAEIGVSYSVMASAVESFSDFYLEVVKNVAGGTPVTTVYGKDALPFNIMRDPVSDEALLYSAAYSGITAKEMGDSFATTLYAVDENGKLYRGETVVSSIKDYLISKIDEDNALPEIKTMAVDMLNYGAAAQIHLNYDTENLVNSGLTDKQLAYATKTKPEAVDHYALTSEGANVNTSITVGSKVELSLSCIPTDVTDPSAVRCVITDEDGNVLSEPEVATIADAMFTAKYDNVGAREMRKLITATFYEGDRAISKTALWSVESYIAQILAKADVSAERAALVSAMLTYGDAVAAYLTAIGQ